MRVTSKGQITIPAELRERFGLRPGVEVDVVAGADGAVVRPAAGGTRGQDLVSRLLDQADAGLSADDVLGLTRWDDDRDDAG